MLDKAIFALPGARRILVSVAVLTLFRALAVIGQAFGLTSVIVNAWAGVRLSDQLAWLALFLGCFIGRQILLAAQDRLLDAYSRDRAEELREALLARTFACGPALVQRLGASSVTTTVIQGIEDVRAYVALIIPKVAAVVIFPIALLAVIFPLDWISGFIALVCFPFIILYMVMIGHTAKDDAAVRHGEFQQMANHFVDAVAGVETLRAFGRSRAYGEVIFRASERFRQLTMRTLRIATLSGAVLDVFATLALAGVAVMLGFRLVDGSIAFFPALMVLVLVPEYFRPIREFAGDYHASLDGRSAFAAIRALLNADEAEGEAEGAGAGEAEGEAGSKYEADGKGEREANAGAPRAYVPELELREVGFSYPDNPRALSDVSFKVSGPCKVGVIGASGSGKSTLMRLLGGFAAPHAGSVILDGAEHASLRTPWWQGHATLIPQDPYLFSATLRENIAFYRPDASEADIARAVTLAGLDELVAELPEGLSTLVGEGGRALSGGQAHRVALARAFLDDTRTILLLDEPTAHLDIETEYELKQRILPLLEGRLVFFATHRLHWMGDMDYVLELDGGHVIWQGPAQEWRVRRGFEAPVAPGCEAGEGARVGEAGEETKAGEVSSGERPCGGECASAEGFGRPARFFGRLVAAWQADEWVRPFFVRHAGVLCLALLLGVLSFAFAGGLMFTAGYMISLAAALPLTVLAVHVPSLFIRIFGLGKPILQYLERLQSHDWALRMTSELRRKLYEARERASSSAAGAAARRTGDVLSLLAEDVERVQDLYLRTLFPLLVAWGVYALVVVALGVFSLTAAIVVAVLLGFAVIVLPLWSLRANDGRLRALKSMRGRMYAQLTDNVRGIADWVFSGEGNRYLERYRALQQEARALDEAVVRFARWRDVGTQALFGFAALTVLVWASLAFGGEAAAGASSAVVALGAFAPQNAAPYAGNWIAAFALCLFPLFEAFSPASAAAMGMATYGDSIERMNASAGDGVASGVLVADGVSAQKHSGIKRGNDESVSCEQPASALALQNVSFRYAQGSAPLLEGVSLAVLQGQKVAVLGRSGAGKSTLAALLRGQLAPCTGRVLVEGCDALAYGSTLTAKIGVIQQDPHLFNWTLRDNLRLGKLEASDEELVSALCHVGLGDLLERLPQGLDTLVDERGKRFSGGERHRIALARVLLSATPIVILDEPFAGLDPETEQRLIDAIFSVLADRTIIMITHHLQGVSACDRVVFLENGGIALDGPHQSLACSSSRYRRLLAFDGLACGGPGAGGLTAGNLAPGSPAS